MTCIDLQFLYDNNLLDLNFPYPLAFTTGVNLGVFLAMLLILIIFCFIAQWVYGFLNKFF